MSCCITIDATTLLCNFFGSPYYQTLEDNENGVSIKTIEKCAKVLANNLPTYLFYDATIKGIRRAINEDGKIFNLNKILRLQDNKIYYNDSTIDLAKCNSCYTKNIANEITQIVNNFFIYKMYRKEIVLLKPIRS